MFGSRYFGPRCWGRRYYGTGQAATAAPGQYWSPRHFGGRYWGVRYWGVHAVPTGVVLPRTIAQAIHLRIDQTPALAALLGTRHWDVATPIAGTTPTPYLVMNQLGRRVAVRTTTGILVVRKYMFRFNYVDSSSLGADLFPDLFGAAFNHHMDPLQVAGKRVVDVELGDAITQDSLGRGGDQKARIQVTLPLDLLVVEPL